MLGESSTRYTWSPRAIDGARNVLWASILMLVFGVGYYPHLIGGAALVGRCPSLVGAQKGSCFPYKPVGIRVGSA
jgi:hypothetical protein